MESWGSHKFADCQWGDKRLNQRALEIGKALSLGFGQVVPSTTNSQSVTSDWGFPSGATIKLQAALLVDLR